MALFKKKKINWTLAKLANGGMAEGDEYQTQTTELPAYAQEYYGETLGRGLSSLNDSYQPYGAARIAPLSEEEERSFDMAESNLGNYQPYIDQAGNYITAAVAQPATAGAQRLISQAVAPGSGGLSAAQKYFDIATNERAMTSVDPYLKRGVSDQNVTASTPYIQKAGSMSAVDAAKPYLAGGTSNEAMTLANPYLKAAAGGSSLSAADPYLKGGTDSFTNNAEKYMNPYNEAVTNRIGEMAGRNLRENILPGINRTFIGGGSFGGKRSAEFTARAVRDATEAATAEQNKALQAGYGQAADIYGAEAERKLKAGQQAGNLSEADFARQLSVGKTYADIASDEAKRKLEAGQTTGSLTTADIQSQLATGKSMADIYSDVASRNLQAGSTAGTVALGDLSRIADIGKSAGALAGDDASRAIQAGQASGQLSGSDADRLLRASTATSGLGEQIQNQTGRDASTLSGIGAQRRGMNQRSADLAYSDFKEERDYPSEQARKAAGLISSLDIPTSTTRTSTSAQPSTLSRVAGLGTNIVGTLGATGGFGKDGYLKDIGSKVAGAFAPKPATSAKPATLPTTTLVKRGGAIKSKRPQKRGLGWLREMKR